VILLAGETMAELRFVRTDGGKFCEKDSTMFAWLARLAAQGLEVILSATSWSNPFRCCAGADHDRVLVDITNSVLSHLDIDELVADVSREIHRFFGVDTVAMVLRDALRSRQLMWNSTDFTVQPPTSQQYPLRR
jgi:hydrogenase-4 transcriptional activator